MAYDPTLPANNSPIVSAELRNQFAGLQELFDNGIQNVNDTLADQAANLVPAIISNAAGPPSSVNALGLSVSNPPTQAQVQAIANKVDELIVRLKRM